MNRTSSRLATATDRHHDAQLARAEAAGAAADRSILRGWNRLMRELTRRPTVHGIHGLARRLAQQLYADVVAGLHGAFTVLATTGYKTAAKQLTSLVPNYRLALAAARHRLQRRGRPRLIEAKEPEWKKRLAAERARKVAKGEARAENKADEEAARIEAIRQAAERRRQAAVSRGFQLFPSNIDELSAASQEEVFAKILFPSPDLATITRWLATKVNGLTWIDSLQQSTSLSNASPEALAGFIAGGFAAGQNPREIAQTLLPIVQGVQTTARRLARTYGMAIAHEATFAAHEALGDEVIGYQVHSAHNPFSRTWHVERDKTIYYKNPGPGQKGLFQMPRPPLEPEDPAERPAGAPRTAYN